MPYQTKAWYVLDKTLRKAYEDRDALLRELNETQNKLNRANVWIHNIEDALNEEEEEAGR